MKNFTYNSKWNLNFYKDRNINLINSEQYTLSDVTKHDYKGWKVISGLMHKKNENNANYAIAISPKQYKQLTTAINYETN